MSFKQVLLSFLFFLIDPLLFVKTGSLNILSMNNTILYQIKEALCNLHLYYVFENN